MFLCAYCFQRRLEKVKSATSKNSLQFPQVVSVINKWAHFHPHLQFPITPTCEQLSIPTNQRLIKLIALPPSGLKMLLAAVPSPFLAISLSLTPPSSISFSISTSHTHETPSSPLEQTFHYLSPSTAFDGFVFPNSSSTNPLRLIGSTPQLECWDGSTDLSTAVFTKKQTAEIILILQDILKLLIIYIYIK